VKTRGFVNSLTVGVSAAAFMLTLFSSCSFLGKNVTPLEANSGIKYGEMIAFAGSKADRAYISLKGGYPVYAESGDWRDSDSGGWAQGYYPGMVWLLYQSTKDPQYYNLVQDWTKGLIQRKEDSSSFGLGQVFFPAFVIGYQVTGNRTYREAALEAAQTISRRFVPAGFFPAWGEPEDTILARRLSIESMMDLEVLYWASEATGNSQYSRQADQHTFFTLRRLVNSDGKILHVADFDPRNGDTYAEKTSQLADNKMYASKGYSPSTVWALGQAWAIYGFTTAYRYSNQTTFLNGAKLSADYFINNLPEDGIPFWDFELPPGEPRQKDSSAGAVAAAGLLKLSRICPDRADKQRYYDTALKIVSKLISGYYRKGESAGVLGGGVFDRNFTSGKGGSTSWGDYYFIEALLLLRDYKA